MKSNNIFYYALLVIGMFFWGLSWPISKLMVDNATPFQIGFFRFIVATLGFMVLLLITKKKKKITTRLLTKEKIKHYFILAVLGIFGHNAIVLLALKFTTSSQASIIAGIQPAIIMILAYLIYRKKISPRWKYWGVFFSFLGVLLLIGLNSFLQFDINQLLGNLLVLLGYIVWGFYSLYGDKALDEMSVIESTTGSSIFGVFFFGVSAIIENKWYLLKLKEIDFWFGIVILALGTSVIGFLTYFLAIKKIGVIQTGIFINLVPVFGTFLSIIILNEEIGLSTWIGFLFILFGIFLINIPISKSMKENYRKEGK